MVVLPGVKSSMQLYIDRFLKFGDAEPEVIGENDKGDAILRDVIMEKHLLAIGVSFDIAGGLFLILAGFAFGGIWTDGIGRLGQGLLAIVCAISAFGLGRGLARYSEVARWLGGLCATLTLGFHWLQLNCGILSTIDTVGGNSADPEFIAYCIRTTGLTIFSTAIFTPPILLLLFSSRAELVCSRWYKTLLEESGSKEPGGHQSPLIWTMPIYAGVVALIAVLP